jgi:hypothetical protein
MLSAVMLNAVMLRKMEKERRLERVNVRKKKA